MDTFKIDVKCFGDDVPWWQSALHSQFPIHFAEKVTYVDSDEQWVVADEKSGVMDLAPGAGCCVDGGLLEQLFT